VVPRDGLATSDILASSGNSFSDSSVGEVPIQEMILQTGGQLWLWVLDMIAPDSLFLYRQAASHSDRTPSLALFASSKGDMVLLPVRQGQDEKRRRDYESYFFSVPSSWRVHEIPRATPENPQTCKSRGMVRGL
jgi:hypothetical protein